MLTGAQIEFTAIDDSTTENGCLRVIPGSHRGMTLRYMPTTSVFDRSGRNDFLLRR